MVRLAQVPRFNYRLYSPSLDWLSSLLSLEANETHLRWAWPLPTDESIPVKRTYLALMLTMPPALAAAAEGEKYDGAKVAAIYYEVRSACRTRETVDGRQLTDPEADKQCLILDALGEQLQSHGYCWD